MILIFKLIRVIKVLIRLEYYKELWENVVIMI